MQPHNSIENGKSKDPHVTGLLFFQKCYNNKLYSARQQYHCIIGYNRKPAIWRVSAVIKNESKTLTGVTLSVIQLYHDLLHDNAKRTGKNSQKPVRWCGKKYLTLLSGW